MAGKGLLLPCLTQVGYGKGPGKTNSTLSFVQGRITHSHVTMVALIRCESACLVCKPANYTDAFYRHFSADDVCFPDNCFNVIKEIYAL